MEIYKFLIVLLACLVIILLVWSIVYNIIPFSLYPAGILSYKKSLKIIESLPKYITFGTKCRSIFDEGILRATYDYPEIEKCPWWFFFAYYIEDFGYVLRFSKTSRAFDERIKELKARDIKFKNLRND